MSRGRTVRAEVPAGADEVFAALTDVAGLPAWNAAITRVVAEPERLEAGAQWVVEMAVLGRRWRSRSLALAVDAEARRFVHRSATDDGNPSYAEWEWRVRPCDGSRSVVTVAWVLHPRTFWRRVLLVRVRDRQLHREVGASLERLGDRVTETSRRG